MPDKNGFTPTQARMIALLKDGKPHTREELHACLDDELSSGGAVRKQICDIRKKLKPKGETIVCVLRHYKIHYQHVRILHP